MSGIDVERYLALFVAEAAENLSSLNETLLRLEANPEDRDVIDEMFRLAHSLKGSFGTMGFENLERLTHDIEQVFDCIRKGESQVTSQTISALLRCCDVLEEGVAEISESGEDTTDVADAIALLAALDEGSGNPPADPATTPDGAVSAPTPAGAVPEGAFEVIVTTDEDCDDTSLRLFMALTALNTIGDVLSSHPSLEQVSDTDATTLTAVVRSDGGLEAIETAIESVQHVSVTVREGAPDDDVPAPDDVPIDVIDSAGQQANGAAPARVADPARQKQVRSKTVRVESHRLDQLMHVMGEVIVQRTSVEHFIADNDLQSAAGAMQELRRASQLLQNVVMTVRMVRIETSLARIPRLVRDLASELGKDVRLEMIGMDTEIDRSAVDALGEPMIHLVRNALDHGIEPPDQREAAGKPRTAQLEIAARHAGGNVAITVRDDGRGVDPAAVAARAVERGVISEADAADITMEQAIELLFAPGFSTAAKATNISGRGVGLDAVRAMCMEWGGDVRMTSTLGQGSEIEVLIPLSLAIMKVLIVETSAQVVAIPIDRVIRTVRLKDYRIVDSGDNRVLDLDGQIVTVANLGDILGFGSDEVEKFGVLVSGAGRLALLTVSGLVGEHETVIKALPRSAMSEMRFSGGFVTKDGAVVLIANCDTLVRMAATEKAVAEVVD